MSSTKTVTPTIQTALNQSSETNLAAALQLVKLGDMVIPNKETITQTAATTVNIATQSVLQRSALMVQSVRVLAGAAAAGLRQIGDSGATASATVCLLSDDGTTLTFEANVTSVLVVWVPRPFTSVTTRFPVT